MMSFKVHYSRDFLENVTTWSEPLRRMAIAAAVHIALDPDFHDYIRQDIVPYRQKHPTTNRQYTLYFLKISQTEIFIVWINDTSCLHTTRANFPDPCKKEFLRRKNESLLEKYDPNKHQVKFEVRPNYKNPNMMCRSSYLDKKVLLNSYIDTQNNTIIGYAFACEETNVEIAKMHVKDFLSLLHESLVNNAPNDAFKIEIIKIGHAQEINLIDTQYDPQKWEVIADTEDYILRKI